MLIDELGIRHFAKRGGQLLTNSCKRRTILIHNFEKVSLFTEEKGITISPTEMFGENRNQTRMSELHTFIRKHKLRSTAIRIDNSNSDSLTNSSMLFHS